MARSLPWVSQTLFTRNKGAILLENRAIFTVTRLNQTVCQLLETQLGQIWVSGEISNLSIPVSGHWYFTLKDTQSQVRCAMFRNSNRKVTFRPQNGQQILVRANITLYEPRGDFQIVIEGMQAAGDGLLQQQFEQLKMQLAAEGLFSQHSKQALPIHPKQIGIITSSSGAVLHDILQILQRRDPQLSVVIYPVAVQGQDAVVQITQAIALANQRAECDLLILARGGGSLEDLQAFNTEAVARAIFASTLPLVSAVGHETDVTIADFVADVRAPTPSAAAEMISTDQHIQFRHLDDQRQRLQRALIHQHSRQLQRLERLQHRLQQHHPQIRLQHQQNRLDDVEHRLQQLITAQQQKHTGVLEHLQHRLQQQTPLYRVARYQQQTDYLLQRLQQKMQQTLQVQQQKLGTFSARLHAISPLATLSRGYAVVQNDQKQMITSPSQVKSGEQLHIQVADGTIYSRVE
ncbi:MAG: exodeoxyribonuclease VII large subunit [Plesiomonas sp.]|uniref:exodeoxyribonuclease VII large subunit n=1 Tax=Plesiomonas sp. TaxID=2486279 RepID=UPI003F31C144